MRISSIAILLFSALLATGAAAQQVRVTVRVIELPHAQVMKWTGGTPMKGWQLHDEAVKLALAGGAEIVETNLITGRSGERSVVESIAEIIYPAVNDANDGLDPGPPVPLEDPLLSLRLFRPFEVFTTFETRNAGVILDIEPTVAAGGKMVDLRLSLDIVDRASLATFTESRDHWGDASVRTPVFDSKRVTSSIQLADGVFELWNVFNPKPVAVPAVTTRMMIFVCADVLPSSEVK